MHLTYRNSEAHASEAFSHADKAGAPEIEVTPEMIEAGAAYLSDAYDEVLDWLTRDRAHDIYEAMAARAPSKSD